MFFIEETLFACYFFGSDQKKNNVFPEPQDEFSKSIAFLFGIHFVFRA